MGPAEVTFLAFSLQGEVLTGSKLIPAGKRGDGAQVLPSILYVAVLSFCAHQGFCGSLDKLWCSPLVIFIKI